MDYDDFGGRGSITTTDIGDDTVWLDDARWTGDAATDLTPLSTPVADRCSDAFESLLDPALFCSKGSTSQPSSSDSSQGINTLQSDGEDELDLLPSLDSLLNRDPTRLSPESHNILIQGAEERRLAAFAPDDQPAPASRNSSMPKRSGRRTPKSPRRGTDVPQSSKRQRKRLNARQQRALSDARKLKDKLKATETEWAQRGYPQIDWGRLDSRLQEFSPALRRILNGSPSFYRSELESAIERKESRRYRCMENATAGYYGPRGQQVM